MADLLRNATLVAGDTIDYYALTLSNRSSLPDSHPLKTSGLQTTGYTTRFIAKPNAADADDAATTIQATLTATDEDNATMDLPKTATESIDFGGAKTLKYEWKVQTSNGARTYTLDSGTFVLAADLSIGF